MTPNEREVFYIDPKKFDWKNMTYKYIYGVEHFMNKQDIYDLTLGK